MQGLRVYVAWGCCALVGAECRVAVCAAFGRQGLWMPAAAAAAALLALAAAAHMQGVQAVGLMAAVRLPTCMLHWLPAGQPGCLRWQMSWQGSRCWRYWQPVAADCCC